MTTAPRVMANPHLYRPMHVKLTRNVKLRVDKTYVAAFQRGRITRGSRRTFKRAQEAAAYARRVHERWCRLYEAAVEAASKEGVTE